MEGRKKSIKVTLPKHKQRTGKEGLSEVQKTGCAKSSFQTRSHLPRPSRHAKVHILSKELLNGIKRSINNDCEEKKLDVSIHENAFGDIRRNEVPTKSRRNNSQAGALALSHVIKSEHSMKRGILKTPNLKALRNSPLWSLSKLIDDVTSISQYRHKNSSVEATKLKETVSNYHQEQKTGTTKETVDYNENRGLKATLAKAIEKVERVVASKHGYLDKNKDDLSDAEKLLAVIKKVNKTIEGVRKSVQNKTEKVVDTSTKPSSVNVSVDPYAEIAAGPDRPKLPELKIGDDTSGSSDSSMMKPAGGNGGLMSKVVSSEDSARPLTGQHDVGGLLDSLTDKLNAAGGGTASEQPLNINDVKFMQQQLGMEEEAEKQNEGLPSPGIASGPGDVSDHPRLSESEATISRELPSLLDTIKTEPVSQMDKIVEDETKMEASPAEDSGLDKEVMDKLAATEEGLSKSITERANSLSKLGAIDILKGSKGNSEEMTDYSDADISPGPDPYSLPQDSSRVPGGSSIGTAFGSPETGTSDLLNDGGSLGPVTGPERSEGLSPTDDGLETAEDTSPIENFEQSTSDLTGNTRSQTVSDSYLRAAMGGLGEDGGFTAREHIPASLDADAYSNSYNTQVFKKFIILRPKRDIYISPFSGKESFEHEI